jgi:hypothetical protein
VYSYPASKPDFSVLSGLSFTIPKGILGPGYSIHLELAVPSIGSTQSTGCFFSTAKTPDVPPAVSENINVKNIKYAEDLCMRFSFQVIGVMHKKY